MADSLAFYEPAQPAHSVVEGAPLELLLVLVRCIALALCLICSCIIACLDFCHIPIGEGLQCEKIH